LGESLGGRPTSKQRRREFLLGASRGLSATALGLLVGCGLPSAIVPPAKKIARVGFLSTQAHLFHEGLWQGLHERGYDGSQNLVIERRSADGQADRLPQLAGELASLKVEVIVAADTSSGQAARAATSTIPIVLATSGDPVRSGLMASFAQPGGNVTGIISLIPELAGKRLELLQQAVPDATRIMVLIDSSDPSIVTEQWDELQAQADATDTQLLTRQVNSPAEVERALTASRDADGLIYLLDPLAGGNPADVVRLAAAQRLAAIYPAREFVDLGGLMSYGPNLREEFALAATYVDRILRGASPTVLPVELPDRLELVINRKTAEALGLTISESVLLLVDEVV
jgi:putative ABC transport system substrate-binding protein